MSVSRPTIHDVASRAGMSKSLVSLALSGSPKVSDKSRAKIERAAEELGYRRNAAARSLAVRRSQTIGILVLDLHNPVFAEIVDVVQRTVRERGFSTMLVSGGNDPAREQTELETLLQFQVEGLILISHRLPEHTLARIATEVPCVTVTRDDVAVAGMDRVSNDDVAGAGLAVDHLVELGHKKIVHLSGGANPVSQARAAGYESAMRAHGLESQISIVPGGLTDAAGFAAATTALSQQPTALFVANDFAAMGAIAAIEEAGLHVPDDVSVIGYDGITLGALRNINLTSIAQPLVALGEKAAERLLQRIESPLAPAQHDKMRSRLLTRGTTGSARS
jgi:DNA-binding LacI/PurR family transcriptional regulator